MRLFCFDIKMNKNFWLVYAKFSQKITQPVEQNNKRQTINWIRYIKLSEIFMGTCGQRPDNFVILIIR